MFSMFSTIWFFLGLGLTVLQVLILARVIISFVPPWQRHTLGRLVMLLSAPVLMPFRRIARINGPGIGIDFSPMIALMIIQAVRSIFHL